MEMRMVPMTRPVCALGKEGGVSYPAREIESDGRRRITVCLVWMLCPLHAAHRVNRKSAEAAQGVIGLVRGRRMALMDERGTEIRGRDEASN